MIILSCPDCGEEFKYKGRFDENFLEPVACPHCYWTASKFTFDYVRAAGEDDE